MSYKKVVMDNGLTVILAEMPTMESVSIGVWIGTGGRYETKEQAGISHFLEHMVFKGTKKRSAQALKETIEGKGGLLNAFTGEEVTCYLAKVLSNDARTAIDVLSDMTLNPNISTKDFLKERFVILEEIKMYKDMPNHYVHELLAELMWPNQPLGMPLTGTVESVSSLKRDDTAFYREAFYTPKNIVIAVAGKPPLFNLIENIRKRFHKQSPKETAGFVPVNIRQKEPAANLYFKETEQTHVAVGLHGLSRFSKDKYKMDLMHIILGGNMSSRLFNEVREKSGLAYEISSSVKHYHDTGTFVISAGIDNKKIGKAVKVILNELKKMKATYVTNQEFKRAKEFYRGQLLMVFEETMSHMLWLGDKFISGDYAFKAKDILKELDKVSREDIRLVARDIFKPENINLAVIGPTGKKDKQEIKKRLGDL